MRSVHLLAPLRAHTACMPMAVLCLQLELPRDRLRAFARGHAFDNLGDDFSGRGDFLSRSLLPNDKRTAERARSTGSLLPKTLPLAKARRRRSPPCNRIRLDLNHYWRRN